MNAMPARGQGKASSSTAPDAAVVVKPTTPNEIVEIMRNRKRFPSPIRPRGSGSSTTRATAAIGGTVVDMTGLDRVLSIGEDTVTVQPGVALSDLAEALREQGMELVGGFDLANRTAGGAVCGAGLEATSPGDISQFAGHATQLKVVGPSGKKFLVSDKTRSLIGALRLSYGLLGIVYEVTVKIRPIRGYKLQTARVSFGDFMNLGPQLNASGAGLRLFLFPFADRIFFELRRPSADPSDGSKDYAWRMRNWALYSALPVFAKSVARLIPLKALRYPLLDNLGTATQSWMVKDKESASSHAVEHTGRYRSPGPQGFTYSTWAFPAAELTKIVAAYKLFCKMHYAKTGFRCDLPTIAYRLGQDRSALLSPSFDGPLISLSPLCTEHKGLDDFMFELAEFAMQLGGVPFFNQTRNATPLSVNRTYGTRVEMFRKIRRQLDPEDRMLNQFFANYFGAV